LPPPLKAEVRIVDRAAPVEKGMPKWVTIVILVFMSACVLGFLICVVFLVRACLRKDAAKVDRENIIEEVTVLQKPVHDITDLDLMEDKKSPPPASTYSRTPLEFND